MKQKMKIKKTSELELKKSMLNVKIFSLMKKQLFSLVMMLALIVIVSTNVRAQAVGNGDAPSTAYWAIVGSQTTHTITLDGSTTAWSVRIVGNTDLTIGEAGTAAVLNTDYAVISGGAAGDNNIVVRWLRSAGAGSVYAVQVIETADADGCTTVRRSYVGVFDFDVDIEFATDINGTGANGDAAFATTNSWCATVVQNTHSAAEIAGVDQSLINNPTDNDNKETSTFFRVTITLSSAPSGFSLANMKWRFQYSLQDASGVSLYDITSADGALFTGEAGTASIGGTANAELDYTAGTNESVYVPRIVVGTPTTATYDFEIGNHNRLGASSTTYSIRLDQVDVEFGATQDYNNGTKYFATGAPANSATLSDGQTGINTINQGPATTTITLTD